MVSAICVDACKLLWSMPPKVFCCPETPPMPRLPRTRGSTTAIPTSRLARPRRTCTRGKPCLAWRATPALQCLPHRRPSMDHKLGSTPPPQSHHRRVRGLNAQHSLCSAPPPVDFRRTARQEAAPHRALLHGVHPWRALSPRPRALRHLAPRPPALHQGFRTVLPPPRRCPSPVHRRPHAALVAWASVRRRRETKTTKRRRAAAGAAGAGLVAASGHDLTEAWRSSALASAATMVAACHLLRALTAAGAAAITRVDDSISEGNTRVARVVRT